MTFQAAVNPAVAGAVQVVTILLISLVALSVAWKGIVPIAICALGITLLHFSIMLPYYSADIVGDTYYYKTTATKATITMQSVMVAGNMYFFLGIAMVALSTIVAYRPSALFTKNRPEPLDSVWSRYPVWHDNALLEGGYSEPSVPVKSLMTDKDRYLLWRYEYILASIYGTLHLVEPDGMVPRNSTDILRDRESGLVIGKARYTGYFM